MRIWRKWFKNCHGIFLILPAFFIHILVLKAVCDIYFSSPIDNGMTPIKSTTNPPAKRLVFIVADGLRAEEIFGENGTDIAPNLNHIKRTRGSWGVAHTRPPTESRPGHVALLGGIYEDPSALFKGWKVNPVDFDSVVNQSVNAWCWGDPSVLNMFNKDNLPHIHLDSYVKHFGNGNPNKLDLWVFNKVKAFIDKYADCEDCKFKQKGNLFFLHLLGTDIAGSDFKPRSAKFNEHIKFVDSYIPKVETWFETAFSDEGTAYVFTADHGMTNWGGHGAGSRHETETPLIAWGKGIKIENLQKDLQQIDIAPLLSALIGINYPTNSLGQLPCDYINTSLEHLSEIMLSHVHQIMEISNVKMRRLMDNACRFKPFRGVTVDELNARIAYLRYMASIGEYTTFFVKAKNFAKFLIEGAGYYHNYYQLPILISLTIGILGWVVFLFTYNIKLAAVPHPFRGFLNNKDVIIFFPLYVGTTALIRCMLSIFVSKNLQEVFLDQEMPSMYYLYFVFPVVMVHTVVRNYKYYIEGLKSIKQHGIMEILKHVLMYVIGLTLLVKAFKNRGNLSFLMVLMTLFVVFSDSLGRCTPKNLKRNWVGCCFILVGFPLLPVMTENFNLFTYLFGYILWWFALEKFMMTYFVHADSVVTTQHIILKLTPLYTLAVEYGIVGFELYWKYFASFWSIVPIMLIPFSQAYVFIRSASIFIGFGTFYLMVTINHESIFLVAYIFLLYFWLQIECNTFGLVSVERVRYDSGATEDPNRNVFDDFRRAFFFIFFIFIGFFGTGNIVSLNSFNTMWVRCFLTVFSRFKMLAIILLRIVIPFIFASCVYRAINVLRRSNTLNIFCIVLIFADIMLLNFLYSIKNVGSWLEIGMSLTEFIIMEAFVFILLLLYWFAYFLTTTELKTPFIFHIKLSR